ncbi:MAG TPA: hypothetical protein VK932_27590 [Kofleriaceae bacterium]|nr:hypothetical protein [Kofleriaceae bacterium]
MSRRVALAAMLAALATLAALAACQAKRKEPPPSSAQPPAPGATADPATDPAAPPAAPDDWAERCESALADAPGVAPVHRLQAVLDNCQPCGDWAPLLRWNAPAADGGPTTAAIEAAMDACRAYCKPAARAAFLGTLEAARGKHAPRPWRELGAACGEEVSAKPDPRYLSAPYFALDRIARAAAGHPRLGPLLAVLELPLPPLSITGSAFVLPASPVIVPDAGPVHVTVTMAEITVGALPRAKLGASGVTVLAGDAPYPGTPVPIAALGATLARLSPGPDARIAVIAPKAMPARRLADVIAAAGAHPLVLAAAAGGPEGWSLPGVVPIALSAKRAPRALRLELGDSADAALRALEDAPAEQLAAPPAILVTDKATIEGLAQLLGALADRGVVAASLARTRP